MIPATHPHPDARACWTRSAEAQSLLADCALNPPLTVRRGVHRYAIGTECDQWDAPSFRDPRVRTLNKLRHAWVKAGGTNDEQFEREVHGITVADAIAAARPFTDTQARKAA